MTFNVTRRVPSTRYLLVFVFHPNLSPCPCGLGQLGWSLASIVRQQATLPTAGDSHKEFVVLLI